MKVKVDKPKEKEFKPLKIELTVETVQEARWLFHVLNWDELTKTLKEREEYMIVGYQDDFAAPVFFIPDKNNEGYGESLWGILREHIKQQGFRL